MASKPAKRPVTTHEEPAPVRQVLRRETRTLSVRLDDEELKIRGKAIGERMGKRRELEEEADHLIHSRSQPPQE